MNNEIKPKQLNNFAKVIQLDQNGNPIAPVKEEKVIEVKKEEVSKKDKLIVIGYIIAIIVLLIAIGLYLYFYVLPKITLVEITRVFLYNILKGMIIMYIKRCCASFY